MTDAQAAAAPLLTVQMMRASKRGHSVTDAAVNSRLVGLFASGKIYAGAIGCFYLIFDTLEKEMERTASSDPRLAEFILAARPMYRAAAFRKDLQFFFGSSWEQELYRHSFFPEVKQYLDHLRQLAEDQPLLLAAHSYTQHSAVASGGQIISRLVRKGLGLNDASVEGTAAFAFSPGNTKTLKEGLKSALNNLEIEGKLSENDVAAIVAQHQAAFAFNLAIIRGYKVGILAPLVGVVKLGMKSRFVRITTAVVLVVCGLFLRPR